MAVKPFNRTICDRVIGCRAQVLASQKLCEESPELTLKLVSSISGDSGNRNAQPTTNEGTNHGLRGNIGHRKGLGPAGELVNADEQIGESPGGRQWADNVEMNLLEAGIRNRQG